MKIGCNDAEDFIDVMDGLSLGCGEEVLYL